MRLQLKTIPDCNYRIYSNQGLRPHVTKALRSMSLEEGGGVEREREEKRVFFGVGRCDIGQIQGIYISLWWL